MMAIEIETMKIIATLNMERKSETGESMMRAHPGVPSMR